MLQSVPSWGEYPKSIFNYRTPKNCPLEESDSSRSLSVLHLSDLWNNEGFKKMSPLSSLYLGLMGVNYTGLCAGGWGFRDGIPGPCTVEPRI